MISIRKTLHFDRLAASGSDYAPVDMPCGCDSKQLNILHLVASVGQRSGGVGQSCLDLVRHQRVLGLNTTIWSLTSSTEAAQTAGDYGLDGASVVTYPVLGPHSIGYSSAMEKAIASGRGAMYDVLHQHSIWMANSRAANEWRAAFGRPTVVAPHGTLEHYALKRSAWKKWLAAVAYENKNLRSASCLHATSNSEAVSFRRFGLVNPIAIIPNGVSETWLRSTGDAECFRRRFGIPPDRPFFLFLSRIHPTKGLPLLLKALSGLGQRGKDWSLVIAGPDECRHTEELQALIQSLGIDKQVIFVGPLYGQDKRDAFAAADVFILPTYSENFGLVVAEALGAGVPVLTTRGAPWEELETHQCGWWVDVGEMAIRDALLDAIQRSKDELVAMGQRGKVLVAERYTWLQAAQRSLELYHWLLGRGRKPDFVITD